MSPLLAPCPQRPASFCARRPPSPPLFPPPPPQPPRLLHPPPLPPPRAQNITVVEGLDLNAMEDGWFTLVCLPVKLRDAEAAPARCVLLANVPGARDSVAWQVSCLGATATASIACCTAFLHMFR
jgi:hypothetical protein